MINSRSIQNPTPEECLYSTNDCNNILVNEIESLVNNQKYMMNNTVIKNTPTLQSSPQMKASSHINQRKKILDSRRGKMSTSKLSYLK